MTQVSSEALRMRMQYNSTARTVTYTFDYDYDGLTFQADQTLPTFSVATQAAEWFGGDRASIFFGGDRSVVFTDLVITTTQAPAPTPTGLQVASVGNATATISWPAGVTGATYSVYRSETSGVFTTPLATGLTTATYTDTTVTNGTPYYYVFTQTNPGSLESAFSNQITATPVAGALPPAGVVAENAGSQAVLVDWADLVSPFDSYMLYRSTDGGTSFSPFATGLTESRYLDEAVTNGNTYIYKVTSVLGGNESVDSATAQAIPNALEVFVDFNASDVNSGRGVLAAGTGNTWNNITGGTSVAISKLNDSSGAVSVLGIAGDSNFGAYNGFNGVNVGGNPATLGQGYNLMLDYRFSDGIGNVRTYTFSGLLPNRKYDLYLFGYGGSADQNAGFDVGGIVKQTRNPVGLTTLTESRHYVTFTAVSGADGTFLVRWSGPGNLGLLDAEPGNATAFNGFQLVENASAVLQPMNLAAIGTTAAVDLNWDDVSGATSYNVYRSATPASDYTLLANSVTISEYSDTTAVAGTPYYYVVKALNGSLESFFSAEVTGTRTLPLIVDADADGLSDADEALIGTNPNNPNDFFVAPTSAVTKNGGNFDVSFAIKGAPGTYVIERSTTLEVGSWTEIPGSSQNFSWNTGTVLDNTLNLTAPALTPAPGGKEFFRAKGVAPAP
jgi:fibronectin type 3 domain-containing protein